MLFQPKFHAFCLLKIGPKICAYLFWCHWMLLRFGDFLQLPFRRFFVKLIQVFHASLLFGFKDTIKRAEIDDGILSIALPKRNKEAEDKAHRAIEVK